MITIILIVMCLLGCVLSGVDMTMTAVRARKQGVILHRFFRKRAAALIFLIAPLEIWIICSQAADISGYRAVIDDYRARGIDAYIERELAGASFDTPDGRPVFTRDEQELIDREINYNLERIERLRRGIVTSAVTWFNTLFIFLSTGFYVTPQGIIRVGGKEPLPFYVREEGEKLLIFAGDSPEAYYSLKNTPVNIEMLGRHIT